MRRYVFVPSLSTAVVRIFDCYQHLSRSYFLLVYTCLHALSFGRTISSALLYSKLLHFFNVFSLFFALPRKIRTAHVPCLFLFHADIHPQLLRKFCGSCNHKRGPVCQRAFIRSSWWQRDPRLVKSGFIFEQYVWCMQPFFASRLCCTMQSSNTPLKKKHKGK